MGRIISQDSMMRKLRINFLAGLSYLLSLMSSEFGKLSVSRWIFALIIIVVAITGMQNGLAQSCVQGCQDQRLICREPCFELPQPGQGRCLDACDRAYQQCLRDCVPPPPPTATIIAPAGGAFLWGTTTVTARVTGGPPSSIVAFTANGQNIGTVNPTGCTSSPCDVSLNWNTNGWDGARALQAQAYNGQWGPVSPPVNVTVDNVVPTVRITQPSAGALVGENVIVEATVVTVGPSGVREVQFFENSALIGSAPNPPYRVIWNSNCIVTDSDNCTRNLTARVFNRAGRSGDSSPLGVTNVRSILLGTDQLLRPDAMFDSNLRPNDLNYRDASSHFLNSSVRIIESAYNLCLRVARTFPNNPNAKTRLLDAMAKLAEGYILVGNQNFAEALAGVNMDYADSDIYRAIDKLTDARGRFHTALERYTGQFDQALPAPDGNILGLILNAQSSHRTRYQNGTRGPAYWDWRMMGKAAGRKAFATRELAHKHWAINTAVDRAKAANLLTLGEIEAIGDFFLLSIPVTSQMPAADRDLLFTTWSDLSTETGELTRAIRYMAEGRNLLGLDRFSVDFIRQDTDSETNFQIHRRQAQESNQLAVTNFNELRQHTRAFERTISNFRDAVQRNRDHYDGKLTTLCGANFSQNCNGGSIRVQLQEIELANIKVREVETEISNAHERIEMAHRDTELLQAINQTRINIITQYGNRQADIIREEARLRADQERAGGLFSGIASIIGGIGQAIATVGASESLSFFQRRGAGAGGIAGGISSIIQGFQGADLTRRLGNLEADRAELQAIERAELTRLDGQELTIRQATFIREIALALKKLEIDLEAASLGVAIETTKLTNLFDELGRVLTERETWSALTQASPDNVFRDPTLRVLRDNYLDAFTRTQYNALLALYKTGLALFYEMNTYDVNEPINWGPSDCGGCQPVIRNLDEMLREIQPTRLEEIRNLMLLLYNGFITRWRPESNLIVQTKLSRLLGFRGDTSSLDLTEYLLNHMVGPYDVFLTFPTNIAVPLDRIDDPDYAQALPPQIANAKIQYIQAYVQGGNPNPEDLPFDLYLYYGLQDDASQNMIGTAYMRRPDADVRVGSTGRDKINYYRYRTVGPATIQAGSGGAEINWARLPRNYKFLGRSLGLDTWGLNICLHPIDCPGNADLVSSFDVIEEIHFRFVVEGITLPRF